MPELIQSYNLVHALFAVVDSGIAGRLGGEPVSATAALVGVDPELGQALLRFLTIRGVVVTSNEPTPRYSLTARGRALTSELSFAQMGFYREAYEPVLERMSPLLRGVESYPKDVQRNGEALGRHCAAGFHYWGKSVALHALSLLGAKSVLDLGCGGGGFLIDACRTDPQIRGIGLDISEGAIEFARKSVAASGVADQIQLFVGDAFAPESWPTACREADAIITVGTLHEQFRGGEDAVIALINKYAVLMEKGPMKGIIIGEPELMYDEHDADFYLMHVFTRQGLPRPREGWLPVFEKTKLRCEEVLTAPDNGPRFAYFVLRPRT